MPGFAAGLGLAAGDAEATGEAVTAGEATGLAVVAGASEAAGEGEGSAAAAPPPSFTTELCPLNPGSENKRARSINKTALITVAFSRGF